MNSIALVEAVDADGGVYVIAPDARGVLRGPYATVLPVEPADRVLMVDAGGEMVVVGVLTGAGSSGGPMQVTIGEGNLDAFSRVRVSEPSYTFDANFVADLQPLLFEQLTTGTGAAIGHDATNRCATLTLASTPTGGRSEMRTFEHFRYQSGRSQLIFATFNMIGTAANVTKFVGYSDGNNGVELRQVGTAVQFALLSDTAKGDETVAQADWNVDALTGSGPSGITLDLTKTHILAIDLQWLGVGRIRVGFDIGGRIVWAHEFTHANIQTVPYMQTANLPVRAGMTCTGTASTTMRFICASVTSEGGQTDIGGYGATAVGAGTAGNGSATHILSVRPTAMFNSITNRSLFVLDSVDVLVTGNAPVRWELVVGQAITGTTTFTAVNATYSAAEYNTAGTASGSPAATIMSGFTAASNQTKGSVAQRIATRYPITLNAAGVARALGTVSVLATGIGATSAVQAVLNWREIR